MSIDKAGERMKRILRFQSCLACPSCSGAIDVFENSATCASCKTIYSVRNSRLYFNEPPARNDALDDIKGRLKDILGRYYYTVGVDLFAPTFPLSIRHEVLRHGNPSKMLIVDAGCGNRRIDDDVLCLDCFDYDEVDIVCDVTNPPLRKESVDAVITRALLEHIQDPFTTVKNFCACTRPGGFGIHLVPFLYPFHASPHDYFRFTHKGLEELYKGFTIEEMIPVTGPVTLFILILQEFLSSLLSFGNERLKGYLHLALCIISPFKFLDFPFVRRKCFLGMAPSILTTIRKPLSALQPVR